MVDFCIALRNPYDPVQGRSDDRAGCQKNFLSLYPHYAVPHRPPANEAFFAAYRQRENGSRARSSALFRPPRTYRSARTSIRRPTPRNGTTKSPTNAVLLPPGSAALSDWRRPYHFAKCRTTRPVERNGWATHARFMDTFQSKFGPERNATAYTVDGSRSRANKKTPSEPRPFHDCIENASRASTKRSKESLNMAGGEEFSLFIPCLPMTTLRHIKGCRM